MSQSRNQQAFQPRQAMRMSSKHPRKKEEREGGGVGVRLRPQTLCVVYVRMRSVRMEGRTPPLPHHSDAMRRSIAMSHRSQQRMNPTAEDQTKSPLHQIGNPLRSPPNCRVCEKEEGRCRGGREKATAAAAAAAAAMMIVREKERGREKERFHVGGCRLGHVLQCDGKGRERREEGGKAEKERERSH
jgi:hypothetical protein